MLPRIHCISDFNSYDDTVLELLASVVDAGVDAVQVRAKALPDRALYAFTRRLLDRLGGTPARVIVDDRLDVALAAGAHGVHLGREDLPVAEARRIAPRGFLVGATCRDSADAQAALAAGADYAGVGPVYRSSTKHGLPEPIGLDTLRETAAVLPSVAVAGVTAARVPELLGAGAHGVAVSAALCRAPDPPLAAKELVDAVLGS